MKVINTCNQSYLERTIQLWHDLPVQLCTFIYAFYPLWQKWLCLQLGKKSEKKLHILTGWIWWRRNWNRVCFRPYCWGLYRARWRNHFYCSFSIGVCGIWYSGFWGIFGSFCLSKNFLFMLWLTEWFIAISTFYLGWTFTRRRGTSLVLNLLGFSIINTPITSLPMCLSTCISTSWSTDLQTVKITTNVRQNWKS